MKNTVKKFKQLNVLYIEDDPKIAKTILNLYKTIFHTVHYCNNIKDGYFLFEKKHSEIDLIVIEAQMQHISGIKMVTHLREVFGYKQAILFTINIATDGVILKCFRLGAEDYLVKPIKHNHHLKVLCKVLQPIIDTKEIYKLNQELKIYKEYADKQIIISKTCPNSIITYVNENFCETSKYTEKELIGKPHNIIRHPDVPKKTFSQMWDMISSGDKWNGEIQNRAKDGSSYFVETDVFPIKDKNNNIIEYMSFRQDVTSYVITNKKTKDILLQNLSLIL